MASAQHEACRAGARGEFNDLSGGFATYRHKATLMRFATSEVDSHEDLLETLGDPAALDAVVGNNALYLAISGHLHELPRAGALLICVVEH